MESYERRFAFPVSRTRIFPALAHAALGLRSELSEQEPADEPNARRKERPIAPEFRPCDPVRGHHPRFGSKHTDLHSYCPRAGSRQSSRTPARGRPRIGPVLTGETRHRLARAGWPSLSRFRGPALRLVVRQVLITG
jgi:hypothetical protein